MAVNNSLCPLPQWSRRPTRPITRAPSGSPNSRRTSVRGRAASMAATSTPLGTTLTLAGSRPICCDEIVLHPLGDRQTQVGEPSQDRGR